MSLFFFKFLIELILSMFSEEQMGWHKFALLSHAQTQADALCHLDDVAELFD